MAATSASMETVLPERAAIDGRRRGAMTDLLARAAVGVLFVMLSANLLSDFMRTRHLTGLLLLASEAMVVVLTIFRRRADGVDRTSAARVATIVSMVGPPLLRASDGYSLVSDHVSAFVSVVGLCLVIAGKLTLGRSFGIVPANRGVVSAGPYLFVRHPIYAGYLITHLAFLMAHPTPVNIGILLCADTGLIARALLEERMLGRDAIYREYCARVAWHLVPGVF